MNLLERVLTLLRANLNSMIEKSDDPEKVLRQLQIDMRNQLVQVKTQVATAIAESRKLERRVQEKQAEAQIWYKKAEQALQQPNESAARDALARYNDIMKLAHRYQQQQKEQEHMVATLRDALRRLEAKIAEVDTTIELLVARRRNALLQQRVFEALSKSGGGAKEKERAARAQDAVMEAEARARAMADLHNSDLDVQLDQLTDEQRIEQQLQEIKARQQESTDRPLLQNGNGNPASLIPPQPQNNAPVRKRPGAKTPTPQPSATSSLPQELDLEALKKLMEQ
ncbi:MAG TPA: PspA/IM30 family protein [Ktedonobacteraceae bacterium]|jgi:phage shock protein A|nr:PspA/IM30 family protein [Ktedonobacteraceae bacterium]